MDDDRMEGESEPIIIESLETSFRVMRLQSRASFFF